jgi:hypothetical protein
MRKIRACQRLAVPNEQTLLVGVREQVSVAGVEILLPLRLALVAGVEILAPRRKALAAGVKILAHRGQALAAGVEIPDRG